MARARPGLSIAWFLLGAVFGLCPHPARPNSSSERLIFEKVFPGSSPEYLRVEVGKDGSAAYEGRPLKEPMEPIHFQLSSATTARLFQLAAEMGYFRGLTLESGLSVARMGEKTFVYEREGTRSEVRFNHTHNETAREFQQLCERIGRGRVLLQRLEYRLLFDRLGVLDVLRDLEQDLNQGVVVDPEQFVPVLEKIRDNRELIRLAQTRAQDLLFRIQRRGVRLQLEYGDQLRGWYYKVTLSPDGLSSYERRTYGQPPQSQSLPVPPGKQARIFELAPLVDFSEVPASVGTDPGLVGYRFTYDDGRHFRQAGFPQPPTAVLAEIVHLIRQLLQQEDFRSRLEVALEKDPLMLQVTLQEFETALLADGLADPKAFLALLESVAKGEAYPQPEREQAERLRQKIQAAN